MDKIDKTVYTSEIEQSMTILQQQYALLNYMDKLVDKYNYVADHINDYVSSEVLKGYVTISSFNTTTENLQNQISTNHVDIASLATRTKNLEDTKVNVNTGTFDPTSDNPAGQTSLSVILGDIELKARYASMMTNGKGAWAFHDMSDNVTTTKTTTRGTGAYSLLGGYGGDCLRMFASNNALTEIADYSTGLSFSLIFQRATSFEEAFRWCKALVRIGTSETPYDVRFCTNFDRAFSDSIKLKEIHFTNIRASFDISNSTAYEEADIVDIINGLYDFNRNPLSFTDLEQNPVLTMGATNLAKLTDAEKAIATNKNWTLA